MSTVTETALARASHARDEALARWTPRYLWGVLLLAMLHQIFASGSRSMCFGGMNSDGQYLDADGQVTEIVPSCVSLTAVPGTAALLIIAVSAIIVLMFVRRRATDAVAVRRMLRGALAVLAGVLVVATVVTWIGLFGFPLQDYTPGDPLFLFGVQIEISPMGG